MNRLTEEITATYEEIEAEDLNTFLQGKDLSDGFWAIDYIGHVPEYSLHQFLTFEGISSHILGDSGILNPFTTCCVPVKNGSVLKYKLLRNEDGKIIEFGKDDQLASIDPFKEDNQKWEIEWKDI